jgi:TusA-related sulfurtransferase
MKPQGFIILKREFLESVLFQNPKLWLVWCYCLLRANHRDKSILFEGQEINLKAGQFITGRYKGSDECYMSPSTFRNQLMKLKKLKLLDIKSDNKKSIITIINWASLQDSKQNQDSKSDNKKRITKGQQKDTDNNDNNDNNDNKRESLQKNLAIEEPTETEIKEYFKSQGYPELEAENFYSYYKSQNWKTKSGISIKDNWKYRVKVFVNNSFSKPTNQEKIQKPSSIYKKCEVCGKPTTLESEGIFGCSYEHILEAKEKRKILQLKPPEVEQTFKTTEDKYSEQLKRPYS